MKAFLVLTATVLGFSLGFSLGLSTASAQASFSCPLERALPRADTYWALADTAEISCTGEGTHAFGELVEVSARYDRFKPELILNFNVSAKCGGGDGSSSEGCPATLQFKFTDRSAPAVCQALDGGLALEAPVAKGKLGVFETIGFQSVNGRFALIFKSVASVCTLPLREFAPDTRR